MGEFFGKVFVLAQWKKQTAHEHFTGDGTLVEAWASMKSFVPKDGSGRPPEGGGKNPMLDFKGEKRSNETHASTTDDQHNFNISTPVPPGGSFEDAVTQALLAVNLSEVGSGESVTVEFTFPESAAGATLEFAGLIRSHYRNNMLLPITVTP